VVQPAETAHSSKQWTAAVSQVLVLQAPCETSLLLLHFLCRAMALNLPLHRHQLLGYHRQVRCLANRSCAAPLHFTRSAAC
jgi:hypothetical protein